VLARGTQKLRQDQLVHADVMCQIHMMKQLDAKSSVPVITRSGIEPLHQEGMAGNSTSCGKPLHMTT